MPEREVKDEKYYESNAGDGTYADEQYLTGVKLFLTLLSVVLTLFASALDQTIIPTLISKIGDEFGDFGKIGWLSAGYMLSMATLSPSWGNISIAFGRRTTMLLGLGFFAVGSLISALAKNMDMLIGGRVIQGIGGGAIQAMSMVILSEVVPISKRALSMTLIGITFSVASALGPFIGGSFASKVTWRWCFWINLPISGVAIVFLLFSFNPPPPEGDIRQKLSKFDYLGTFLMTAGLVLVLLALTFGGNEFPWKSAATILCFILGGILIIVFCVYNFKYSKHPIIIKEAITTLPTFFACLCGFFAFIQFMTNVIYFAVFFQVVQNASSWQSGVDLLPFVITVSVTSICNGLLLRFFRYVKISMMLCAISALIGSGLSLLLDENMTYGRQFGIMFINGIAAGLSFQSSLLSTQVSAPTDIPGSMILITSFNSFCKSIGGVIGSVVGQLILQNTATSKLADLRKSLDTSSGDYKILKAIKTSAIVSNPLIINKFPSSLKKKLIHMYVLCLHDVFYLLLAGAAILFVFAVFTTNKRLPTDDNVATRREEEQDKNSEELLLSSEKTI